VDLSAPLRRFDRFQHRRKWLAIPVAVVKKFSDDDAGRLAAVVAYYGFLSLFPLLLVFVTILGFVLSGNQSLLQSAKDSVLGQFPIIGDQISDKSLEGNGLALAVGVLISVFAGLGITDAARYALDRIWGVPRQERASWWMSRLRGLGLLLLLGGMFVVASAATGIIAGGLGSTELHLLSLVVSLLLNFALFMLSFRLLCSERLKLSWLAPGAAVAACAWWILTALGGKLVERIAHSHHTAYGVFALVLGVIAWLHLGAQATVYSAELNVVLARRLWPKRLFSDEQQQPPPPPGAG
jgi:YihY family inner membrane protein